MTTEYTPTTAEVDEYFAIRRERAVEGWYAPEDQDRARKEWDLMLAAHDARVRAEALREAATDENVEKVASAYATHVTGYSMRDGGYTYTCRCGWSESGEDALSSAQKHRARAALQAVLGKEQP